MTSFMAKKKKYKFQVEICLEELLEVPFVSAVLFAKLRLLDGGSFQDHSSRQEVRDHKVQWDANFSFPCKMMANASTGVMEKCVLRISIRKESKGGRSFNKLGFVDLNLAEYAGAGIIHKKALLEGYDTRHRQDNSMLKFRIQLNMISGDILFKAPSPSLKHKQNPMEEAATDQRSDEYSSGSLAGSINSGSSGFGSLPKKRTPLPTELVKGQGHSEAVLAPPDGSGHELTVPVAHPEQPSEMNTLGTVQELGHSRNSSNTSQMSKASGYSSISHSRQSSSGDSTAGHIRNMSQHESLRRPVSKFHRTYTFPKHRLNIPTTILSESPGPPSLSNSDGFHTPQGPDLISSLNSEVFYTPQSEFVTPVKVVDGPKKHRGDSSAELDEAFKTPEGCSPSKTNIFDINFNALQRSASSGVVERRISANAENGISRTKTTHYERQYKSGLANNRYLSKPAETRVLRSKSDFVIPKLSPLLPKNDRTLSNVIAAFLTPRLSRKEIGAQSTPVSDSLSREESRAASMGNLKFGIDGHLAIYGSNFGRLHRKMLLDGPPVTKLTTCDSSPDDCFEEGDGFVDEGHRRSSTALMLNPSSGSIHTSSDTGSLDRAKAAYERRKKNINIPEDTGVSGRVETTRVNPEDLIADLLKGTNLEPPDDSAETSGLQLFIAKDGTASLGSHEVKSQMSTGINTFKQVVMDDR